MQVAAVQMRSGVDVATNIATLSQLVNEAVDAGARYVQTPEMTGLLQANRASLIRNVKSESDDLTLQAASDLARKLSVFIHIGSTPILLDGGKVANRSALFAPDGKVLCTYDKIHMFDVDLDNGESWRESAIYEPGGRCVIADLGPFKLGLGICYDVRFPELFRQQALAGAQVLTVPAAFTRQTGAAHWHVLLRARAIENGAFVIAAAQGGQHEDGRETFGHSIIVDPWGEILAEKADDQPGIIIAEIDLDSSVAARAKIPNLQHSRPFDVQIAEAGQ